MLGLADAEIIGFEPSDMETREAFLGLECAETGERYDASTTGQSEGVLDSPKRALLERCGAIRSRISASIGPVLDGPS